MGKKKFSVLLSVIMVLALVVTSLYVAPTNKADAAGYVLYEDFTAVPKTSSTAKNTSHGVWSTEYSSSLGVNHVSFHHSSFNRKGSATTERIHQNSFSSPWG